MDGTRTVATHWVFGYGSLMWRPGFAHTRAERAVLSGWHRSFCIYSTNHRGSTDRPGLVLGLDRGGQCEGVAYLVPRAAAAETLAYLRRREQVSGVYRERLVTVRLGDGSHHEVQARTYVVERHHPSYAGRLPLAVQAELLRGARGISGFGLDYLANTLAHMAVLGIRERDLERLAAVAHVHVTRVGSDGTASAGAKSVRTHMKRHAPLAPRLKPLERRRFVHRKQLTLMAERDLVQSQPCPADASGKTR